VVVMTRLQNIDKRARTVGLSATAVGVGLLAFTPWAAIVLPLMGLMWYLLGRSSRSQDKGQEATGVHPDEFD